jgi:hypothetical protein
MLAISSLCWQIWTPRQPKRLGASLRAACRPPGAIEIQIKETLWRCGEALIRKNAAAEDSSLTRGAVAVRLIGSPLVTVVNRW